MKLLYGVQGTGNGHITRARAMQRVFAEHGVTVDWVFSGRAREDYFDMAAFGDFNCFRGLSFVTRSGRVDLPKTFAGLSFRQMARDINRLNLDAYDLIITDFEPVTAWAARQSGRAAIGLGHQYAFTHAIPHADFGRSAQALMRWFAPVQTGIGLHWHSFGQPVLPPLLERHRAREVQQQCAGHRPHGTLVYLPFEDSGQILALLQKFEQTFYLHCKDLPPGQYGNVQVAGFSREGFQNNLARCDAVISNAGFELVSEALQLGRRILVKPVLGQFEQASNALALQQLRLAMTTEDINTASLEAFFKRGWLAQVDFPDIAPLLLSWMQEYPRFSLADLAVEAWRGTRMPVPIPTHKRWSFIAQSA